MSKLAIVGKLIGICCVPLAFFDLIGHPATVIGSSMEPTLNGLDKRWWRRDVVWLSRLTGSLRLGDIVTFIPPHEPLKRHIKRIAAMPGDLVHEKKGNGGYLFVPPTSYWMVSDNERVGDDSHSYGPVNDGLILSKATAIIWPPNRWRSLSPLDHFHHRPIHRSLE